MLEGQTAKDSEGSSEQMPGTQAQLWAKGEVMGNAQNWARYLSDMPANKMTPIDVAEVCMTILTSAFIMITVITHLYPVSEMSINLIYD